MTAVLSEALSGDRGGPAEAAGDEPAACDPGQAKAVVRDGLLMVFGPDGDPLPPTAVDALAADRPGATVPYEAGRPVPLERLAQVLEVQAHAALAPEADEAHARNWIEAMLGLGEAAADVDATLLDDESDRDPSPAGLASASHATTRPLPDEGEEEPEAAASVAPAEGCAGVPDRTGSAEEARSEPWPGATPSWRARADQAEPGAGAIPVLEGSAPGGTAEVPEDESHAAAAEAGLAASAHGGNGIGAAMPDSELASDRQVKGVVLELPAELCLGRQGVLGLGAVAAAVAQVPGPILYVRVDGVPEGALLTAGRNEGGGSWSLTAAELERATLVAAGTLGDFRLEVLATSGDLGDLRAAVHVTAPAEPGHPPADAQTCDTALVFRPPLSPQNDPERFVLVRIDGLPPGATLSAGVPERGGRAWVVSPRDLPDLRLRRPADAAQSLRLTATAVAIDDRDGAFSTVAQDLVVAPRLDSSPASDLPAAPAARSQPAAPPVRRPAVPFDLRARLQELGGEQGLTAVAIGGLAGLGELSQGTFDEETGAWVLRPNELDHLLLRPAAARDEDVLPLHLKVTGIRADAGTGAPAARSIVVTVARDPTPVDLPVRPARPGGIGFFRPLARRHVAAP